MRVKLADPALLAAVMRRRELSNRGLAAKAGVAHGVVAELVSGRKPGTSTATASALAEALEVDPALLFAPGVSKPLRQNAAASS